MFATASLFADGSLGKDPELTSDPRDISGARKKPYTVTHYGAQAGGDTATPYVAIQYRSNIDHFRVAPIRWTVEAIWGTLRNARCILGQSNWSVFPFGLFFHTMRKRERESWRKDASLEDLMDYLSGKRVDCSLVREGGREVSDLAHYDYIDLVFATRKVPSSCLES